ncbi:CYFA0S02e04038g1_1 [Cyberlindnera fabianii]|uniref:CYFA0S02e04038g1_1 n=1 Tax=Cyberlindnera fabianii TaxID=36022 RepID=A0A061AM25_CYBFA|nr:Protein SHQ1 [Cyberlindnera fabianii]CDR38643.1 CYFA0S02e04038g1_1 [Cyberlindnera fabianii]
MLTPRFTCRQDDEFVYIDITVSHIRFDAPGVQIVVENELLVFSLSPYYLRLRFDKPLIDDEERSSAQYESKEECIKVKIPKLNKGDVFEDLDLPAKLMARSGETQQPTGEPPEALDSKQLLQEIGISTADEGMIREADIAIAEGEQKEKERSTRPLIEELPDQKSDLEKTAAEAEQFNWEINQTFEDDSTIKTKYGFDNQYDSVVGVSISNGNDINELDDPEHTSPNDRIKERLLKENFKFDPEYYAADYMTAKYADEDEYSPVKDLLKYNNPLITNDDLAFTQQENDLMIDLPSKSYVVSNPRPLYYTIISLLFSYSFEMRQTEGEFTSESAWSIGKLTPQIATLDTQIILPDVTSVNIIKATIITGVRRALSYPLNRNYELVMAAWRDAVAILGRGKKAVIKALLATREPFRFHDIYYCYNKVLLEDLVNWLVKDARDNDFVLKSLSKEVEKHLNTLEKTEIVFEQLDDEGDVDTSLNIAEIEQLAEQMYNEQGNAQQ